MRHRTLTTLIGASLALAVATVPLPAQQSATVTLRSGQVVSGDLVDLGGVGFTIRVNGEQREIPKSEVRLIDFGSGQLTAPEAAKTLEAGSSVLVLRNGDTLVGDFYDISGTQPLRLTFRTANGERVFQSNDVRAVYLARTETGTASSPGGTPAVTGRTVTVSARTAWTPTGITVSRGQTVTFSSSGEITFSPQSHKASPAGSVDHLFDTRAPLPTALQGALIARIGTGAVARGGGGGRVVLIGNQNSVVMPADGQLFLGVNDSGLNDNRGEFSVVINPGS